MVQDGVERSVGYDEASDLDFSNQIGSEENRCVDNSKGVSDSKDTSALDEDITNRQDLQRSMTPEAGFIFRNQE